ncbi:MAG: PKD domain-containing protein [Thermoplasmatota archaeon]
MRYSRSVLSIAILISLIFSSILILGSDKIDALDPPSRLIVMESENNGAWSSADQLPGTTNSRYELHGNISSSSDLDFFQIDLNGGSGPVDMFTISPNWFKMTSGMDLVVVWISAFYPDSNSENVILVNFYDQDQTYTWWRDMSFYASYTGMYGIRFEPYNITTGTNAIRGNLEYNFTISISSQTPSDPTNDQGSSLSLSPGTGTINTDVNVVRDMMDWYKIPAPSSLHPTKLDMQVALNSPYPDFTSSGIYYGIELDVFVKYNSRADPGTFQTTLHRISVGTVFQNSIGCSPSPKDILIEKNCTEMYIGLLIRSFGVNPSQPSGRTYQIMTEGRTSYILKYDISANIPNKRPQLLTAAVDKLEGRSDDTFTFSVTYRDPQNESAKTVELWKDGEFFRKMLPLSSSGEDYVKGVRYETQVFGSQIGSDGDYFFNISASDGKDWAVDPQSGIKVFSVRVDNNLAPSSKWKDYPVETTEDPDTIWVVVDSLFSDYDEGDVLSYSLLHPDGVFRGPNYILRVEDRFEAQLINNGTQAAPEWRLKVDVEENVNGILPIVVNATDDAVFSRSVEVTVKLDVKPVNDPPVIKRVGAVDTSRFKTADFHHLEQGELEEISIVAEDIDEGDVLKFTWDIGSILKNARRGTNYDWNRSSGDLWFRTTDGDVPGFETTITVSDGKGGTDSVLVTYDVENVNDPPVINVPSVKSTIEGEYLYINPTYDDPDLDSGDIISFTYTMGELERVTPSTAVEFSQATGRLVLQAVTDEMNGEWEINITVVDLYGLADWGICKVTIGNVNDPPVAFPINLEQLDENLTVTFHTIDAEDEDEGDVLTYIWDFGDGSDIERDVDLKDIDHTFPAAGAYTVTLTVYDGYAYSDVREIIVTVTAPPPDPDPDGDGIPTEWEEMYGLDPNDPTDAEMDYDNDGLTNLQEYNYYHEKGFMLNPRNPDTDGDGYDDGEEVEGNYDPMDPEFHPEDPNKDLALLLWLGAAVLILLAVLAGVVFSIFKIRNRPKAMATPALPPIPSYQAFGPSAGYDQFTPLPPESQLPPGESYDPGYYQDQQWPVAQGELSTQPYGDGYLEDGYYAGEPQEGPVYDDEQPIQYEGSAPGQEAYPETFGEPTMESTLEQAPIEEDLFQESGQDHVHTEHEEGAPVEEGTNEAPAEATDEAGETEGEEGAGDEEDLPPPPSLPDI